MQEDVSNCEKVIFAGSGGQGVMLLGKLLTRAMMEEGKNVTFMPAYGTEVRGGTANCQVVISDEEIYSPLVEEATSVAVMNAPSYEKFIGRLAPGGLLIVNSSLVRPGSPPDGVEAAFVPASEIANSLGDVRAANIVILGAYNTIRRLLPEGKVLALLEDTFRGDDLIRLNKTAFRKGVESVCPTK